MSKKTVKIVVKKKFYLEIEPLAEYMAQGMSEDEAIERDILDLESGEIDISDLTWVSWDEDLPKVKVKK